MQSVCQLAWTVCSERKTEAGKKLDRVDVVTAGLIIKWLVSSYCRLSLMACEKHFSSLKRHLTRLLRWCVRHSRVNYMIHTKQQRVNCASFLVIWQRLNVSPVTVFLMVIVEVVAWHSGNIVERINEVTLCRAQLVLGWVTVFGG